MEYSSSKAGVQLMFWLQTPSKQSITFHKPHWIKQVTWNIQVCPPSRYLFHILSLLPKAEVSKLKVIKEEKMEMLCILCKHCKWSSISPCKYAKLCFMDMPLAAKPIPILQATFSWHSVNTFTSKKKRAKNHVRKRFKKSWFLRSKICGLLNL